MKLKLCSLFSLAIVFAATPLRATTYYWKPGSTVGDYGTLSNWSTEGLTGADAAVLPGSGDALYYKGSTTRATTPSTSEATPTRSAAGARRATRARVGRSPSSTARWTTRATGSPTR